MTDDLTLPWFLDRRNPEVQARLKAEHTAAPVEPPHFTLEPKRDRTAEELAFLEAEEERERIEKENRVGKLKAKKEAESQFKAGGRFSTRDNRWISAEEDFANMAAQAKLTVAELHAAFVEVSKLPDMPLQTYTRGDKTITVDPNEDCCRAFARRILKNLDNAVLAREAEKAAERARRKANRDAKRKPFLPPPRRRRAA